MQLNFWLINGMPLVTTAALGGAGTDKIALYVGQAAENGNHQTPGAGAGVGPSAERSERRGGSCGQSTGPHGT